MNIPRPGRDTPVIEAILDERNRTALSTVIEIVNRSNSIREALLKKLYEELRALLPGWDISGTPMEKDDGLASLRPTVSHSVNARAVKASEHNELYARAHGVQMSPP